MTSHGVRARRASSIRLSLLWLSLTFVAACGGTLDAGSDRDPPLLPAGQQNPVILCNDGAFDNWQGEYAALLASSGGPPLVGLVVSTGSEWTDLDAITSDWQRFALAARASGLSETPDPVRSASVALRRPDDGDVASTVPNGSEGARFIVETSSVFAEPGRPVAVVTGGRLTDIADAYLIDPTIVDRVIVVSSLGSGFSGPQGVARMGGPNGELDSWASTIVVQKFRYVQVSARYEQLTDVPDERLDELPNNPFGDWMRAKQPEIFGITVAADQVGVLALGVPGFIREVVRVSQSGWAGDQPTLAADANGRAWLVTASDGAVATARFWRLLLDSATFAARTGSAQSP